MAVSFPSLSRLCTLYVLRTPSLNFAMLALALAFSGRFLSLVGLARFLARAGLVSFWRPCQPGLLPFAGRKRRQAKSPPTRAL